MDRMTDERPQDRKSITDRYPTIVMVLGLAAVLGGAILIGDWFDAIEAEQAQMAADQSKQCAYLPDGCR